MKAIYKKELKGYFCSATGYVFIAFMLLFAGIYVMAINIKNTAPNFEYVVGNMSFIFMIIVPVLTMKVVSEERKQKTDTLLYSLPVSLAKIIAAKYFAMLTVLGISVLIMCIYPIILSLFGTVNLITAYSALFGFFLLGAALISMGLFASSLTDNQAFAAAISFAIVLINYFISSLSYYISATSSASMIAISIVIILLGVIIYLLTKDISFSATITIFAELVLAGFYLTAPKKLEGFFPAIMGKLSVFERFYSFVDGVFDVTSTVYLLMLSLVFVFLTVQSMEKRRWS